MEMTTANPETLACVGCAGWSIPKPYAPHFPVEGTHLERYAARFPGVEINSSFYRPHRPQTYAKWAASVPEKFRFAVKAPKVITHERRLANVEDPLQKFLDEVSALGNKLGPLLVQLPPSLIYSKALVDSFLSSLRHSFEGQVVCEPRHLSWFTPEADELLTQFRIGRVAADPAVVPQASEPGGWNGLTYYRLHGSPTIYRSAYSPDFLHRLSADIRARITAQQQMQTIWVVFDNTAEGAATADALELMQCLLPAQIQA